MNTDIERGGREHVAKQCMVEDCEAEAEFWIDATHGLCPSPRGTTPDTFYLCLSHQDELNAHDENDGGYIHLRADTGEVSWIEIANYACHPDCDVCNN